MVCLNCCPLLALKLTANRVEPHKVQLRKQRSILLPSLLTDTIVSHPAVQQSQLSCSGGFEISCRGGERTRQSRYPRGLARKHVSRKK